MPYTVSSRQAAFRTMWVTRQTRLQTVNCWWPDKSTRLFRRLFLAVTNWRVFPMSLF